MYKYMYKVRKDCMYFLKKYFWFMLKNFCMDTAWQNNFQIVRLQS